jgi:hypothetical protein
MIKKNTLFGRRKEMKTFLFAAASVLILTGISSAGVPARIPVQTPALAPWGMVGTAVAMGLSGLYFIIKRHK